MAVQLDDAHREWLALALIPGVGTAKFIRLLARFHTPGNVLRAPENQLADVAGPALAKRIRQYKEAVDVTAQERAMEACGARFITLDDPEYPVRLAEIYDPPLVLFVRGELWEQDRHCVAVVGTRRPTPYGVRMAEKFGAELAARGVTVVSGMAAGVDAAAHRGALEAGGRTIAILGCGVDVVYPRQHEELMEQIVAKGCVMSQFEMGAKPSGPHFPVRNRVISGMTLGTLVVEGAPNSGALITARHAAEQGREVFAIPGQVGVRNSQGPHGLIREGAKLVETVGDILVELDVPVTARQPERAAAAVPPKAAATRPAPVSRPSTPLPAAPPAPQKTPKLSGVERDVLSALAQEGSFVDEISQVCRISVSEALSTLTILELKGLVRQFSGKRFAPR